MAKHASKAEPKPSIIHWHGILADSAKTVRAVVFGLLSVIVLAFSFLQLGLVGVGANGDYTAYIVMLLPPIALGALCLGMLPGTALGLIAGAGLYAHALLQPLDYYELAFVTPLSSIVQMTALGLFLGFCFALALRKEPPMWRRFLRVSLICLVSSALFSLVFSANAAMLIAAKAYLTYGTDVQSANAESNQLTFVIVQAFNQLGDVFFQVWVDAAAMALACIAAIIIVERARERRGFYSLRTIFRTWLFVIVFMVFLVWSSIGFAIVTEQAKWRASSDMSSEIEYLLRQLEAGIVGDKSITTLLDGYTCEEDGIVVIYKNGYVLLSDDKKNYRLGTSITDYLGNDAKETVEELTRTGGMRQIIYDESLFNLGALTPAKLARALSGGRTSTEIVYLRAGSAADYIVTMMLPSSMVYENRATVMLWVRLSALVLLGVVFIVASRLLNTVVVRRIDETNEVLSRITAGDLDAVVDIRDSREFSSLSDGINTTVAALKSWIGEAEERMAAELATAKAIQESALPRTFPAFPDIDRFDIFASMNAAKEVGGDFYDFFLVGEESGPDAGKLAFVMADVSGKGIPAALFMMTAKTLVRDNLRSGMDLGAAIELANEELCADNDAGMFVTLFAGVLDYATGCCEYVNAGHNPPLLCHGGSWRWVSDRSGLPLGLFEGRPYKSFELTLAKGDELFCYTDGVTEAMNVSGELYGEERLEELAAGSSALGPHGFVAAVGESVTAFADGAEQSDDITMLALRFGVGHE